MPNYIQQAEIEVDTVYQTDLATDAVIEAVIAPASTTPNTVQVNLNLSLSGNHVNETPCEPGELVMVEKNALFDLSFEIDDAGNLIVNALDANNYTIDAQGNLIYTYR